MNFRPYRFYSCLEACIAFHDAASACFNKVQIKRSISSSAVVYLLLVTSGHGADNVRIAGICDDQAGHSEVLSASGAQLHVGALVVMHTSLGQHRVVLDLGFSGKRQRICNAEGQYHTRLREVKTLCETWHIGASKINNWHELS